MRLRTLLPLTAVALTVLRIVPAHAAEADPDLSPVVVTVTRIAQPSSELPASVDRIDQQRIRQGQLQVNLSESLAGVPGLSVQSRQNYAQDLQVSVRGFGARSSFGVRGVRLYADGFPEPCLTARASSRISIWHRLIIWKCCVGRSRRCTVILPVA